MYRSAARPEATGRAIELRPHRGRRIVLGFGLWFLCIWFLIWPVAWVVHVAVTGEGPWRLALAPFVWVAVIWAIARTMRMETVVIGARRLHRAGFLRDRSIEWASVTGVREFERRRSRGGPVRIVVVEGEGGELPVAPGAVADPGGVLRWAIDAAVRGDAQAIDERVRAEGAVPSRFSGGLPHLIAGLVLSLVVGGMVWKDQTRKVAERTLRVAEGLPHAEKVARLAPLIDDDLQELDVRCRAASSLAHAAVFRSELVAGRGHCQRMRELGCAYMPWDATECEGPFTALPEARRALEEGDPARALALVRALDFQGGLRNAIEVPALVALGRAAEARELAERCVRLFGDSEDPIVQGYVARCREAL